MLEKIDVTRCRNFSMESVCSYRAKETASAPEKKDILQSTSQSNLGFWGKFWSYFSISFLFSFIKQYICCCLFDEEEELREKNIQQLDQFSSIYATFDLHKETSVSYAAKVKKAFYELDPSLQNSIKKNMRKIVRFYRVPPSKEKLEEFIKSTIEVNPKYEFETGRPSPDNKLLLLGESLKNVLRDIRTPEPV